MPAKRSRALDWFTAGMLLVWGLTLSLPGDTLRTSIVYEPLLERFPENVWAALLITAAVMKIVALLVNGARPRGSPLLRWAGAFVGVLVWAHFLSGSLDLSMRAGAVLPAVGTNLVLLGADVFSCFRAAGDFRRARHAVYRH